MRKLLFILACLFVFAQQAHGQGILQNPIQGPITASSTNCATQGDQSCLWMKLPTNAAVVSVTVSGTFSETLVAEYTGDSGAHWTTAATLTTAGLTSYVVAGMTDFRVRASAVVSGTALITIQASLAPSGGVTSGTGAPSGSCTANQIYVNQSNGNLYTCSAGSWVLSGGGGSGTVTSVSFTGGLISVATPTTTPALTVAGTSGGIPYFSGAATWASSAAGTVNTLMKWGGAGNPPIASLATDDGTTLTYTGSGGVNSGGNVIVPAGGFFGWTGRTQMQANIDGDLVLTNNAQNGFTKLTLGVVAASVPALCPSGTTTKFGQANASCTTLTPVQAGGYLLTNLLISNTAPTIAAGGCGGSAASISASNGTAAFNINVGTGPTSAGCTITLPAATAGWNCSVNDFTTISTAVSMQKQTASGTTSATFQNYSDLTVATAPTANDIYHVSCFAY